MQQISSERINLILKPVKIQSDRIMDYALVGYFILGLVLAFYYNTYLLAFMVGGLCLVAYYVTKFSLPNNDLYQYVCSAVFAVFTAQFIYQMHGMFEMHFFVFVGSTLLITFQKWKLQLPLIILVVLHHSTFAYLQYSGAKDIYFTQLDYMDLYTFIVHGALAALIVGICGMWSFQLKEKSIDQAKNLITLQDQMKDISENIAFAKEIGDGNLATTIKISEDSQLGEALINMHTNLVKAAGREKVEKFVNTGLARISDVLRRNINSLPDLCNEVVLEIVKYLEMNQGAIYIAEDKTGEKLLTMKACYAFNRKKYLNKSILPGEGLVGQCFLEKEITYLVDIPDGYIKIRSGLGDASPSSLILVPMINNEKVIGVLELASFHTLPEETINFLFRAAESLASVIVSLKVSEQTMELLEQSQQKEEEMKAQEEEMRQNMEELEATQEELNRKNKEFESKSDSIL